MEFNKLTACVAWGDIKKWAQNNKNFSLSEAWDKNPQRDQTWSFSAAGINVNFSNQWVDKSIAECLLSLADEQQVQAKMEDLCSGEVINFSEKRAAWHVLARADSSKQPAELQKINNIMQDWSNKLRDGVWRSVTGDAFNTVIQIGIGGSHYGSELCVQALAPVCIEQGQQVLQHHFVSNIDAPALKEVLAKCNSSTTCVVIISKSFTSAETLENARCVKLWLQASLKAKDVSAHLFAVTAAESSAKEFGIIKQNILPMLPEIGGRTSLWSSAGVVVPMVLGWSVYAELCAGAREMDQHVLTAPADKNIALWMALINILLINGFNLSNQAILVYAYGLRGLLPYLQQLQMESLGKSVTQTDEEISEATGAVIWGGVGTDCQHTFHQHLMQSPLITPAEFIVPAVTGSKLEESDKTRCAHAAAQIDALSWPNNLNSAQNISGNRPSTLIALSNHQAHSLGALLALYEHRVFYHAMLLGINPFDQFGVEQAKRIYKRIFEDINSCHESTQSIWKQFKSHWE